MDDLRKAGELHTEYRMLADRETQIFSDLMTAYPLKSFPRYAARVWQCGMLAEIWGVIATQLSPDRRDYIDEWRTGK